ncbi:phosphatidate cytidylyltransferase [bacterium]|nr:MAG: phosphatidate cytidylyltransferase [bacterium]
MIPKSEYIRKLIHLSNLIIPISYYYVFQDKRFFLISLFFLVLIFLAIDLFREKNKYIKIFFNLFFNKMMRKHELNGALTGASWVMISAFFTILIFPKNIAILSLIFMSIGDTVAGLAGRRIGKLKIGEKTVEGFVFGFLACAIISYNYKLIPFSISIYGSLVGMIFEVLPLPLDDNLKIPLSSASIMYVIESYLI